jgi:hypothetical protein
MPPSCLLGNLRDPRAACVPRQHPRHVGHVHRRSAASSAAARRGALVVRAKGEEETPDWEQEMSIFAKRISRPNQLATLRELEAKVAVGKVSQRLGRPLRPPLATQGSPVAPQHCMQCSNGCTMVGGAAGAGHARGQRSWSDIRPLCTRVAWGPRRHPHPPALQVVWAEHNLAIITGINSDAPLGTKLAFVSGGTGWVWGRGGAHGQPAGGMKSPALSAAAVPRARPGGCPACGQHAAIPAGCAGKACSAAAAAACRSLRACACMHIAAHAALVPPLCAAASCCGTAATTWRLR